MYTASESAAQRNEVTAREEENAKLKRQLEKTESALRNVSLYFCFIYSSVSVYVNTPEQPTTCVVIFKSYHLIASTIPVLQVNV